MKQGGVSFFMKWIRHKVDRITRVVYDQLYAVQEAQDQEAQVSLKKHTLDVST